MIVRRTIVTAAFALCTATVFAQKEEPIGTDRPDFTESTETVPFRRLQLEGGYTFTRTGSESDHAIGELLLRIATGRRTEARISLNSLRATGSPGQHNTGTEDATLGLKVKLLNGSPHYGLRQPNLALILATSVPSGSTAYRESKWQPEAKLCVGWDLSKQLALSGNLNYTHASEKGTGFHQMGQSLSLGVGLTERVGAYLEYFGFMPASPHGPNANYINSGLTYLATSDYQLDLRAGIGMNGLRSDYFVGLGAARRW